MKRKHDVFTDDDGAADMVPLQRSPARSKNGRQLRGEELVTEVKHFGSKGWGLIAKQHARQGELILEYVGELISKEEAQQRTQEYEEDEIESMFLLHLSPSNVIDATRKGNNARYMKHASNANCQSQKWVVDNQLRAYMIALRDIAPGEELTFDCYRQCSLGTHVRCMCGPIMCHSNQGTPVLQSVSETERMADAVLKCIQANEQTSGRHHMSTPPHSKQDSPCTVAPLAYASPPHATREDINALGLDSPDSFLDHLHQSSAQRSSSLQAITSRCLNLIGQLADTASDAGEHQQHQGCLGLARQDDSGAMLAVPQDATKPVSRRLLSEAAQQQSAHGKLSRFAHLQPAEAAQTQVPHDSPAQETAQQLQSFLAQCKHVVVGGYDVVPQTGQIQKPALPYTPMKSLKSVLGPKLQAGNVVFLDLGVLRKEAGWPAHLWSGNGQKSSPMLVSQAASLQQGATSFALQPLVAVSTMPSQDNAATPGEMSLLDVHQPGCMQPPAAVRASCALTGKSSSPSSTETTVTEQQQPGQHPAVPPVDAVFGGPGPPNTPEGVQICLASLGLTSAQIQTCLENAQRIL